jgi:hypothetical protein
MLYLDTRTPATARSTGGRTGDPTICSECGTALATGMYRHEFRQHTITSRLPTPLFKVYMYVTNKLNK